MRRAAILAAALVLAGCGAKTRVEVVVIDPGATGARLELCGRAPEVMPRTAEGFELRRPADCRGAGRAVVRFASGAEVGCPVRLVAVKLNAWYRFRLEGGRCWIQ